MPATAPRALSTLLAAAGLTALPPFAFAQDAAPLELGPAQAGSLESGSVDAFTLELPADHFVFGHADQLSCDVVVTIYNPDGEIVGRFDGPARGPETFQFQTEAAGMFRIEVTPFEDESGRYEIMLRRSEPVADTPAGRVDQMIIAYDDPRTPGGVVAVVQEGEIVFSRAFGSANLTHDIPFTLDTRTNIGSTSKQFTAMAIMLLAERGLVTLDDDIRDHVPELPDFGQTVTLRHLLTHTSGYREYLNTLVLSGRRFDRGDSIDPQEIIEIVQRQPELQNEPGAEWNYNNTAFSLLATVVTRVTGEPFPDWMRDNVFLPLGMDDTFVRDRPDRIIAESAQGYTPDEDGGFRAATDLHGAMGAGGIYASVEDLALWVRNYATNSVGTPETFDLMTTPYTLNDGEDTNYGFGLFIDDLRGLERIHHGGADVAHRSMIMYFPEIDAAVITQSNNANFAGSIADRTAIAFFEEHMDQPESEGDQAADSEAGDTAFDPESFEPEVFDEHAGRYELEAVPGFVLTFRRDGETYYTQATGQPELEIVPVADNEFKLLVVDARVRFDRNDEGKVDAITLFQNGEHTGTRLEDEDTGPAADDLAAYVGRYFSEELETFYHLRVEEGELVLTHRRFDDITLTHNKDHSFTGGFPVATADFEVDDDGNVVALLVGNVRARGVRFDKTD